MKALSLWQPWASAIALDAKRIETRGWATSYRGPLAIHAAQRLVKGEILSIQSRWGWNAALDYHMGREELLEERLPFGAIVAVCRLCACVRTETVTLGVLREERRRPGHIYPWTEEMMGDFSPGRYAWVLGSLQPLATPIPYRGRQGLFEVPDELLAEAVGHG